jgi:hypothetical protein
LQVNNAKYETGFLHNFFVPTNGDSTSQTPLMWGYTHTPNASVKLSRHVHLPIVNGQLYITLLDLNKYFSDISIKL